MENLKKLIVETGMKKNLPPALIRHCLERAVEGALCEFFEIRECDADVEEGTITAYYHVGEEISLVEGEWFYGWAFYGDVIPVEYKFAMFEDIRPVVERARELFERFLVEVEADELMRKWRSRVRQAVEGVIVERHADWVEVELGDSARGFMPKRRWVKAEAPSYRKGKLMYFYVIKAARVGSRVDVELSRGSKGLPAALIELKAPWVKVKPLRRIAGKKSWIVCDTHLPGKLVGEVSKFLNGEVIEVSLSTARPRGKKSGGARHPGECPS